MKTAILAAMTKTYPFWTSPIRMIVLVLLGLALLAFAFFTLAVLLPIAVIGGIALHFYLRHRLRKAQRRGQDGVIEVEYTVVDRR
ncbi:hypothetical protein [Microvirga lenta]|uniref:hypothetical protein n=1 Tax=Microvirga lenta TaxID=2881337 RepID=UPI001CFF7516|nr:hypothetical protein [Microvirga lenta]MCB5177761.1 hypothetical protein [Microvirga lenta]